MGRVQIHAQSTTGRDRPPTFLVGCARRPDECLRTRAQKPVDAQRAAHVSVVPGEGPAVLTTLDGRFTIGTISAADLGEHGARDVEKSWSSRVLASPAADRLRTDCGPLGRQRCAISLPTADRSGVRSPCTPMSHYTRQQADADNNRTHGASSKGEGGVEP